MFYIDGFVIVVLIVNKQQFIEYVCYFDVLFIELGVLWVIESWGDDVFDGKVIDFWCVVQVMVEEMVVFLWVEWFDKVMWDVGMRWMREDLCMDFLIFGNLFIFFDGMCMIFGGFEQVVEVKV